MRMSRNQTLEHFTGSKHGGGKADSPAMPGWALPEPADEYGNATCKVCGKKQAPSFGACIQCCSHDELRFDEEWDQGWHLTVECAVCGKNFDFTNDELMRDYKAVRRSPNAEVSDGGPLTHESKQARTRRSLH
jgi:hypothetical protein